MILGKFEDLNIHLLPEYGLVLTRDNVAYYCRWTRAWEVNDLTDTELLGIQIKCIKDTGSFGSYLCLGNSGWIISKYYDSPNLNVVNSSAYCYKSLAFKNYLFNTDKISEFLLLEDILE